VETFVSAQEFLRFAPPSGICCLVLDVHVHGMSGLELRAQLAAECRAIIPIIFIAAHDDARTRERIRTSGAAGY
jgi:FixJ family two-component response regulator